MPIGAHLPRVAPAWISQTGEAVGGGDKGARHAQGLLGRIMEEIALARTPFVTMQDAAATKLAQIFPHSDREGIEYGFIIYEFGDSLYVTPSVTLGLEGEVRSYDAKVFVAAGGRVVAIGHTHQGGEAPFSTRDFNVGRPDAVARGLGQRGNPNNALLGIDVFMTNRSGRLYQINPFGREIPTNRDVF